MISETLLEGKGQVAIQEERNIIIGLFVLAERLVALVQSLFFFFQCEGKKINSELM